MKSFLLARGRSFGFAWNGLVALLRTQWNARIHAVATAVVIIAGIVLDVSRTEWCLLVLAMGLVWAAECINTAIEALADTVSTAHHPGIGRAKDVAAGAVLVSAATAVVIGLMVLGPKLARILGL